jgi:hypothetical protein
MLGNYGGGRSKPTWAERIRKKYLWIGMYKLAAQLNDHIERKRRSWEPEPLRTPFILLEERKHDPTLPLRINKNEHQKTSWWSSASVDFGSTEALSDVAWVEKEDDIPALESFLSVFSNNEQNWRVLVSYPSWDNRKEDTDKNAPYRNIWMHINSYLVKKPNFSKAYYRLKRRNFFGDWLPGAAKWSYGFAGEYPWATPFNIESDEWHGSGGHGDKLSMVYKPSWNTLVAEWEYDASLPQNYHMLLPARSFFSPGDLWWDREGGYGHVNGRLLFKDPSIKEAGPSALIADADDLHERLKKLGLKLIWTILGEKWILGSSITKPGPRRIFSQVAYLNEDGSLNIGDRVFFEDYDKDTGLKI